MSDTEAFAKWWRERPPRPKYAIHTDVAKFLEMLGVDLHRVVEVTVRVKLDEPVTVHVTRLAEWDAESDAYKTLTENWQMVRMPKVADCTDFKSLAREHEVVG